jgi:hypothetical protein
MNCETFRAAFHPGIEDAGALSHLRACDRCLDSAAAIDPDVMFRAIGGSDLVPPGGVDAFVDDVMRQVRVRDAEKQSFKPRMQAWPRRLAVAATLTAAVFGTLFVNRYDTAVAPQPIARAANVRNVAAARPGALISKPIVESYESSNATILEVPNENSTEDVKIVMIFDESLPADL